MTRNVFMKRMMPVLLAAMMGMTACVGDGGGRGNGQGGPGQGGPGQGSAPPEAIKACEDQQEGDSVTFSGREGESISATCQLVDGKLVAVPEGHGTRQ